MSPTAVRSSGTYGPRARKNSFDAALARRSRSCKVVHAATAACARQGQRQHRVCLGLIDVQDLAFPVDRVNAQRDHLARAQPVVRDQVQDAQVAPAGSAGAVDRSSSGSTLAKAALAAVARRDRCAAYRACRAADRPDPDHAHSAGTPGDARPRVEGSDGTPAGSSRMKRSRSSRVSARSGCRRRRPRDRSPRTVRPWWCRADGDSPRTSRRYRSYWAHRSAYGPGGSSISRPDKRRNRSYTRRVAAKPWKRERGLRSRLKTAMSCAALYVAAGADCGRRGVYQEPPGVKIDDEVRVALRAQPLDKRADFVRGV